MADQVAVNSVQPSEVSSEMVAYLLTVAALNENTSKGWQTCTGLPVLYGHDKEAILSTYADCIRTVRSGMSPAERAERSARR
jgi:hypothetical protein